MNRTAHRKNSVSSYPIDFKKICVLCEKGKWKEIQSIKDSLKDLRDEDGRSIFVKYVQANHTDVVEGIIQHKLELALSNDNVEFVILVANQNYKQKDNQILEILCNQGLFVKKDTKGRSPLYLATKRNHHFLLPDLLTKANHEEFFKKQNGLCFSPISLSIFKGHIECLNILLGYASENYLRTLKVNGMSVLHLMNMNKEGCKKHTHQNPNQMLKYLLKEHGDQTKILLERPDNEGKTPLIYAAMNGNRKAISILMKAGADINASGTQQLTPLKYVGKRDRSEIVDLLLKAQKLKEIQNDAYQLPIELGREDEYKIKVGFQGNEVKIVNYIGIVKALEIMNILQRTHCFLGTSAASIPAALLALGVGAEELRDLLENSPFEALLENKSILSKKLFNWLNWVFEAYTGIPNCTLKAFGDLVRSGSKNHMGKKFKHLHLYSLKFVVNEVEDVAILHLNSKKGSESVLVAHAIISSFSTICLDQLLDVDSHNTITFSNSLIDLAYVCKEDNSLRSSTVCFSLYTQNEEEKVHITSFSETVRESPSKIKQKGKEKEEEFPNKKCVIPRNIIIIRNRNSNKGRLDNKSYLEAIQQVEINIKESLEEKFSNPTPRYCSIRTIKQIPNEKKVHVLKWQVDAFTIYLSQLENFLEHGDFETANECYEENKTRIIELSHLGNYLFRSIIGDKIQVIKFLHMKGCSFDFRLKHTPQVNQNVISEDFSPFLGRNFPLMHIAIISGSRNCFNFLLNKTNHTLTDDKGNTILHAIVQASLSKAQDKSTAEYFYEILSHSGKLTCLLGKENHQGLNALFLSAQTKKFNLFSKLLEYPKEELTIQDEKGNTLLSLLKEHFDKLEEFLRAAKKRNVLETIIDKENSREDYSLLFSTKNPNSLRKFLRLAESGFNLTKREIHSNEHLLYHLIKEGFSIELVNVFCQEIKKRISNKNYLDILNQQVSDKKGKLRTSLILAARMNRFDIVVFLINEGADFRDKVGKKTPIKSVKRGQSRTYIKQAIAGKVKIKSTLIYEGDSDPEEKSFSEEELFLDDSSVQSLSDSESMIKEILIQEEPSIYRPSQENGVFSSFLKKFSMRSSSQVNFNQMRTSIIKWMKKLYTKQDNDPQKLLFERYLLNSLLEHYYGIAFDLQTKSDLIDDFLKHRNLPVHEIREMKKKLRAQNLKAYEIKEKIKLLNDAKGKSIEDQNISKVTDLIEKYFSHISKHIICGGEAELFALSCRYRIPIVLHEIEKGKVSHHPYEVMNKEFVNPRMRFAHSLNYYKPI
jgi:ankyrin repeat protein